MKKLHKALFAVLCAMFVMLTPACIAEAEDAVAGQTISVSFSFNDIRGIDGTFSFSNRDMFSSITYSSTFPGARFNNNKVFYSTTETGTSSGTITVTATVSNNASKGDMCIITLGNINLTDGNTNSVNGGSRTEMVTVVAGKAADTTQGSSNNNQSGGSSAAGNSNQQQQEQPSGGSNGSQGSSNPIGSAKVDLSELKKCIEKAGGINEADYTKESREVFQQALQAARDALNSSSQSTADAAAAALQTAIDGLVKMDYSKLQAAIDTANGFVESEETAALLKQLTVAVNNGVLLLESDDQSTVDEAAEEINSLLEQIRQSLYGKSTGSSQGGIQTEPEGEQRADTCDKTMHKVWPFLFFISLAGNIALALLIVLGIRSRARKSGGDIALVDYDIEDDALEDMMAEDFEMTADTDDEDVTDSVDMEDADKGETE